MPAPIALFVYNRPLHTRQTIEALLANHLASESDIFIFSDAARNDADKANVYEVREYIKTVSGFRSVSITEQPGNIGLANSVIRGVTDLCNIYGRAIVLEDDLLTAPNFLVFLNNGLERYNGNQQVYSITGYSFTSAYNSLESSYFLPLTSTWGWGTWKDKWDVFSRDSASLARDLADPRFRHDFNLKGSFYYAEMAENTLRGRLDSWGIYWYYSVFRKNGIVLYPAKSLVRNIGYDGTGTHSKGDNDLPLIPSEPQFPARVEVNLQMKALVASILRADKDKLYPIRRRDRILSFFNTAKLKRSLLGRLIHFWTSAANENRNRYHRTRCVCADDVVLYPSCAIDNSSSPKELIWIGSKSHVRGNLHIYPNGGRIVLGESCYVGDQTRIWSMSSVLIGNRVLISHGVNIHDHNSHALSAEARHVHWAEIVESGHPVNLTDVAMASIVIDDDVWIGFNATILKGVKVGRGAIIAAGSVVTHNVPEYSVVAGNPAMVIKRISN